jgi:hypothetical protein
VALVAETKPTEPAQSPGRWSRLLPAATFVVGLALGSVLVAVSQGGDDQDGQGAAGTPTPSASDPDVAASDDQVVLAVPQACRDAAENLRQATSVLGDAIGSVRDFDPDQLVKLLNQLEDLDNATRPLTRQCSRSEATVTVVPSATPTAAASASG